MKNKKPITEIESLEGSFNIAINTDTNIKVKKIDTEIKEKIGLDPSKMDIDEKIAKVREYRYDQFEKLTDAVYKRRGWTNDGVPTIERLKEIGMDLPELIEIVKPLQ